MVPVQKDAFIGIQPLVYLWKFKREYCNNCILVQRVLGLACFI
jgi:hypothetical protein